MQEHTLILGDENHLVATLTELPANSHRPRCVAILTNSGVIPRTGPHRMNVHLARQFAALGIPSIRFDLSGLGDSLRHSSPRPVMEQWVADTRAVMDMAERHFHCPRFVMVGFCSGAEVAHLVALEDTRLRAALLWDLYAYPTTLSRLHTIAYRMQRAGTLGLARKSVGRIEAMAARLLGRKASPQPSTPPSAVPSSVPPKDLFAQRIQTLVDQGVKLLFAYALQPEWFTHRGQFQQMFRGWAFTREVELCHLDRCDHLLTQQTSQDAFSQMTHRWLTQKVLPAMGH